MLRSSIVQVRLRAIQPRLWRFLSDKPIGDETSKGDAATVAAKDEPPQSESKYRAPKTLKPQERPQKQERYFAVRKGREIGVFKGWDLAKRKVLGFEGAVVKSFKTEDEAKSWLEMDASQIDEKYLGYAKKSLEDKDELKPSKYVLDFGAVISSSVDPSQKGLVGLGWVLRKFPERTLIVAGCDQFDINTWRKNRASGAGYSPKLPRELPMLEALNRGLDEVKRVFKIQETIEGNTDKTKQVKLAFPLDVRCSHVYTVGLLTGANPTLPDIVSPLKQAKSKMTYVASSIEVQQVSETSLNLAQGMAKAALARKYPSCTIEGGHMIPSFKRLVELINQAPDVPPNTIPVNLPPTKPLEVNGVAAKLPSAKQAEA